VKTIGPEEIVAALAKAYSNGLCEGLRLVEKHTGQVYSPDPEDFAEDVSSTSVELMKQLGFDLDGSGVLPESDTE